MMGFRRCVLSRPDLWSERNAATHDAVGLGVGLRQFFPLIAGFPACRRCQVVPRVGLADMGGERALEALGITAAELKVVVLQFIATQRRVVGGFLADRRAAAKTPDHTRLEKVCIHAAQRLRLGLGGRMELGHELLEAPEHHEAAVLHPRQAAVLGAKWIFDVFLVLFGLTKDKLSRPIQVGAWKALVRVLGIAAGIEELRNRKYLVDTAPHGRLGDAVEVAEVLMAMFSTGPRGADFSIERYPCAAAGRLVQIGQSRLEPGLAAAGDDQKAVEFADTIADKPVFYRARTFGRIVQFRRLRGKAGKERLVGDLVEIGNTQLRQTLCRERNIDAADVEQPRAAVSPKGHDLLFCQESVAPGCQADRGKEALEFRYVRNGEADKNLCLLLQAYDDVALDLVQLDLLFSIAVNHLRCPPFDF